MLRQFNLRSSGKDIPVPSRTNYMKKLISQTETFLKNIRWKTFWFERKCPQTGLTTKTTDTDTTLTSLLWTWHPISSFCLLTGWNLRVFKFEDLCFVLVLYVLIWWYVITLHWNNCNHNAIVSFSYIKLPHWLSTFRSCLDKLYNSSWHHSWALYSG